MQTPNKSSDQNEPGKQNTRKIGFRMYIIAWILGVGLLTKFFSGHQEQRINPNQSPESRLQNGVAEVVLQQNTNHYYILHSHIFKFKFSLRSTTEGSVI